MKIELDIPEWAQERHIYVFAGIELLGVKTPGGPLKVKTGRCSMCGRCCKSCEHLLTIGQKRLCRLGSNRPFACGASEGPRPHIPECTESYEFKSPSP